MNRLRLLAEKIAGRLALRSRIRGLRWRIKNLPRILPAILANPGATAKFACATFIRREMSLPAFYLQIHGTQMLGEIVRLCDTLNIRPFLAYGTLLGSIRENAFIETDNDIDLGVFERDSERLPLLRDAAIELGYRVRVET